MKGDRRFRKSVTSHWEYPFSFQLSRENRNWRSFSPNWGVLSYGKSKGRVPMRCSLCAGGFVCAGIPIEILCWFRLRRLAQSVGLGNRNSEGIVLPGVRVRFRTRTSFCMAGAESVNVEIRNLSFRGMVQGIGHFVKMVAGARRSVSWTLPKRWQACVIRGIVFYMAGAVNPHHGCYVWRSKGSLELELEKAFAWPVQHFVSWFRGRRDTSEAWLRKMNPLRRSCVSSARNAGKVAFSDFEVQPFAEIVRVGMLGKLRFRFSNRNP